MKKAIAATFLIFLLSGGYRLDASQRSTPRRFALLIDERHSGDVHAMQQVLVNDFGYSTDAITVITGHDATGAAIRQGILKFAARLGPSDSVLLLLSLPTRYGPDGLQMLPADNNADQPWTAIRPEEVFKTLGSEPRNWLMILPYCLARGTSYSQSTSHPVYWPFENLFAIAVCPRNAEAPADMPLTRYVLDGLQLTDASEIYGDQLADVIMRKGEDVTAQLLSARPYTSIAVFIRQKNRVGVLGGQLLQSSTAAEKIAIIRQLSDEVAGVSADRRVAWAAAAGNILVVQLDGPSPDPNVQLEAARAIARIQYIPGIDALRKAIDSSPESLRSELAIVIGQFPPDQALPAIEMLLKSPSPTVRAGGLRALADMQKEKVVPLVQTLLQSESVQEVSVIGLQLLARLHANDPESLKVIKARLSDPQPAVRSEAAGTLAMLNPDAARKPILDQLANEAEPLVRERAAYTAGRYYANDAQMEPILLQMLKSDSQESVRRGAAWVLGQMGSMAARDELTRWLLRDNADPLMRGTAAEALGFIGDPKSVPPLVEILNGQHHATAELQVAAAAALGDIGGASTLRPLLNALKSPDYSVRNAASISLDKIQTSATQTLDKQIHDPSPRVRAAAVAKIRPDSRKSTLQLIEALSDSNNRVQDAAVKALSQNPCSECQHLMAQELNTLPSPSAKVGILRAIQAIHDPQLSTAALSLASDRDSGVRLEVVRLAGQSPSDQALSIVMNAADDSDVYVRATAASSLGRFQSPQADNKLKKLTLDHSTIVRDAAVESLVSRKQQD